MPQADCCQLSPCNGLEGPHLPYSVNPWVPDRDPSVPAPTALYRFWDIDGQLLYVGITDKGIKRFQQHRLDHVWFWDVTEITIDWSDTRDLARKAEQHAIRTEGPLYNIEE